VPPASDSQANAPADERAALIATRLRQNTGLHGEGSADTRMSWYALEHAVASDLGHLHKAHDLRLEPITSARRIAGPLIVHFKRRLQRLIHPLPEAQSTWNGANARVMTFMLHQMAEQAQAIESLEQQLSDLYDEVHR
jgi:hypothetical protein